jgi:hypothetical protein
MIFTKTTAAAPRDLSGLTPAQWAAIIKLVMELLAILNKKSIDDI